MINSICNRNNQQSSSKSLFVPSLLFERGRDKVSIIVKRDLKKNHPLMQGLTLSHLTILYLGLKC